LPAVKLLERARVPRVIAIVIVYLVVLSGIGLLLYLVATTTIDQIAALAKSLQGPINGRNPLDPIVAFLHRFGITNEQINGVGLQIANQAEGIVGSAVPLLTGILNFMLDIIIVAVLSIYLLIDGERVTGWLRRNMP